MRERNGKNMREKVIAMLEEILNLQEGTITEETRIDDVDDWDSLAHVMIIGELEERFGICIPLDEAIELTSVSELFEKGGI